MRQDQEEARLKRQAEIGSVTNVSGVGPVHSGMKNGVPFARNIPIEGMPGVAPKIMPQQFVKTMDAAGNPVMRIATQEELQAGVPLYEKPEGGAGFILSPGQMRFDAQGNLIAEVPANNQSRPLTPTQTLDLELKAIRLVKEQRKDWFDNDRYSDTFGQVKPEFAGQFEAEVSRRVQAATGGVAMSAAPSPAQGGGAPAAPQTPQATIKIGDTYTGDDGKQYRYVGGNKGEVVEQATQGFDPFANPGVYTPPQPAAPKFDMMNTIAAQNTGASPTAANILQAAQSQDAAADAAAKARAQELHAKLSKLTPRVINAALSQEPPSVQSWYRAINSAAMGQVGSNNPEQVTQGFRPVTPVSTLR